MSYTHLNRPLKLMTVLGEDALLLERFHAQERLSAPFLLELELVSPRWSIPFESLLGSPVVVSLTLPQLQERFFHGHIHRFVQGGHNADGLVLYRAEVVPWLWFLNLNADCRIFQDRSTRDIVTKIFQEQGVHDFEFRNVTRGTEPREYCVQYRETAFNFVSRLMEEDALYYYFEHQADKHLLVIADEPEQHPPCPHGARVSFDPARSDPTTGVIQELKYCQELQTGKVLLRDFDFMNPKHDLEVQLGEDQAPSSFDYPGRYLTREQGEVLARIQLQEQLAQVISLQGSSTCMPFSAGHRFKLDQYYRETAGSDLVLGTVHHVASQSFSRAAEDSSAFQYRNTFTCFPARVPFRPVRRARKPLVAGTQTAIVSGKPGEEIWTDEYGRVKVLFHWDREGELNERSSCWIRVAHHWAGRNWGALFLPRIGQEVIVDFLEGDPDRPIIIGRVYNADQMPPYPLPAEQTKSTLKSDSSKGGGGSNELRFEDRKGSEELYIHAQKDFNEVVEHNHTTTVKVNQTNSIIGNQSESVGGDQSMSVSGNRTKTITKDETVTVQQNRTQGVTLKETITVGGTRTQEVTGKETVTLHNVRETTIDVKDKLTVPDCLIDASTSFKIKHGDTTFTLTAGHAELRASSWVKLEHGNGSITIEEDGKIVVSSGTAVELKCGDGSRIVIDSSSITMTSGTVKADGGGGIATFDGAGATISGNKVTSSASGLNEITGIAVKIN